MESFKLVRNAIAKIIRNSEWKDRARGVVFYYKYDKSDDIKVLVLPLFEEYIFPSLQNNVEAVMEEITENVQKGNRDESLINSLRDIIVRIQKKIEERTSLDTLEDDLQKIQELKNDIYGVGRVSEVIFHSGHFKSTHETENHFIKIIEPGDIINYTLEDIKGIYTNKFDTDKKRNKFDQYYFDSGCNKLLLVPIPLLSTPAVVLALDFKRLNGDDGESWKDFVHFIYNHTSGTINFHIYNNLMKKLNDVDASNETELIYKYAQTLAEIMLPIDYKVYKVKMPVKHGSVSQYDKAADLSRVFYQCHVSKVPICGEEQRNCNDCKGRKNRNGKYEIVLTEPVKCPHSKSPGYKNSLWPSPVDVSYLAESDKPVLFSQLTEDNKININKYDYQFKFDLTLTTGNQENKDNKGQEFLLLFDETSYKVPKPAKHGEFIWVWGLPDYATNSDQLRLMLQNIFNVIYMQWLAKRKIREHSVRSAIAAIMARNISHNLGSHVLAYLRTQLSDVQTLIKSNSLRDIISQQENLQNVIEKLQRIINGATEVDDQLKKIELPFLVGLGHLLNYMQERQDFIATISTNHIPYSAPINFKDIVYDELNHDYKAIRHHKSEGFKFNQGDNLLLEHIAHSEGYKRKHISIWFREFDGLNNKKYKDDAKEINSDAIKAFNRLNEIEVILPGGAVGRQAFFSIIENFIRNSAKHANKVSGGEPKLDVYIDLIDLADENEKSELKTFSINSDEAIDMKDISTDGKIMDDSGMTDFFRVELSDNISDFKNGEDILKKALKDDYILEDGSLKEDYKGIKEMRISATWLRFLNDEHILENENGNGDITKKYPPVLQLANKDGKICYVFYLLKPKELLFVSDKSELLNIYRSKWKNEFEKMGWKITSFKDFDKNNDPRYRLIVFDCDENNEAYQKLIKKCHSRVIADNKIADHLKELFEEKRVPIDIFNQYYKAIIDKRIFSKGIIEVPIVISDDKNPSKLESIENKLIQKANQNTRNDLNIIYKKHLETSENLKDFEGRYVKKPLQQAKPGSSTEICLFVESITGNNSTDRLIRKGNYDERWYLNMLESALTNVIIIDERLWGYYAGIDESELNSKGIITLMEEEIGKLNNDTNLNLAIKYRKFIKFLNYNKIKFFCKGNEIISSDLEEAVEKIMKAQNLNDYLMQEKVKLIWVNRKTAHPSNFKFLKYKNLWVFNIVRIDKQHALYDTKPDNDNDSLPLKIADISINENGVFLHGHNEKKKEIDLPCKEDIHFICVHQGLIDKLYNSIKNTNTNKAIAKSSIINSIKNELGNHKTRIIIHSGRSRPPKSDLPEEYTFLQYSAISHAIKDCKHSLTELLYSARI